MLEFLTAGDLEQVHADLDDLVFLLSLMQAKRRNRGAYTKPGLADSVQVVERRLLASFDELAQDVVASLAGQADDVASGRIAQADEPTDAEVSAAVTHFDLPLDEFHKPVDKSRLEAILALILLWRRRHQAIADAEIQSLFAIGHQQAMEEAGQTSVMPAEPRAVLRGGAEQQFSADLDRLETALRDGTGKAKGIRSIVETAGSVGAAAALLLDLFNRTKFRVEMFAEALVWTAWMDGFRSGAVDATHAALRTAGVDTTDGLSLTDLSAAVIDQLPKFQWTGPDDEKTCKPCKDRFGDPIVVLSIDDMPAPETICRFKRACRHWWEKV